MGYRANIISVNYIELKSITRRQTKVDSLSRRASIIYFKKTSVAWISNETKLIELGTYQIKCRYGAKKD
jgi:hypothetical protein